MEGGPAHPGNLPWCPQPGPLRCFRAIIGVVGVGRGLGGALIAWRLDSLGDIDGCLMLLNASVGVPVRVVPQASDIPDGGQVFILGVHQRQILDGALSGELVVGLPTFIKTNKKDHFISF